MFKTEKKHSIDVLFVITLFFVFALSVVVLTGTGASVYENIVNDMSSNYDSRTSFSYVINKVRQGDASGCISVGSFSGCDALIISEEIDNITYCTYLYYFDGYVREFFTRQGQEFDAEYGTGIFEANGLRITEKTDTLYKIDINTSSGYCEPLYIHLRSNGGVK